ncbi:hypothetical protein [Enterobacter ludwigii]
MRLIEVLQLFQSGMEVRHEDAPVTSYGVTIINHEGLVEFLASRSQEELLSDGWRVLLPGDAFWRTHLPPEGFGYLSRCKAVPVINAAEPEKLPFNSESLLTVLRRELDIPDRRDVIVRELWLAMQLLATPESCADFMRRSLVINA